MIQDFTFSTTLQLTSIENAENDLQLIHKYADPASTLDDFAVITMTAINDKPLIKDGLRLIVSREFQEKHVGDFVGKPFCSDHRPERSEKLGRIFRAQLMSDDQGTSTTVKAFIPKLPDNENDIERIRLGQDLEVSLGFRFSKFEEVEINGVPHIKILPSDNETDGISEVSLVGIPAAQDARITAIAAAADIPLKDIPHHEALSADDSDCLLFGKMYRDVLADDVISYERQMGIATDMKLASDSYRRMSPFALQDRRESLLNTLKKNEKQDTQISVDVEALLSRECNWNDEPRMDYEDLQKQAEQISQNIRS